MKANFNSSRSLNTSKDFFKYWFSGLFWQSMSIPTAQDQMVSKVNLFKKLTIEMKQSYKDMA